MSHMSRLEAHNGTHKTINGGRGDVPPHNLGGEGAESIQPAQTLELRL